MKRKSLTASYKIALGGILAALAVTSMLISNLVPIATYGCPALAGMMLIPIVIEIGRRWAVCVYAAISLLSIFLVADKEAALFFVAFFGFYPIIKAVFEEHLKPALCWLFKILMFSLCMSAVFFVSVCFLDIPKDSYTVFGFYIPWAFLIVGIFVFWVYDIALSRLIAAYVNIWRKKLLKRVL